MLERPRASTELLAGFLTGERAPEADVEGVMRVPRPRASAALDTSLAYLASTPLPDSVGGS